MKTIRSRSGFTLLEMMVGVVIFVVLIGGIFVAMKAAQTTFATGEQLSAETEKSAAIAEKIRKDLEESSIRVVDTSFRYHYGTSAGSDYMSNHFYESLPTLRECSSSSCPWNTDYGAGSSVVSALPQAYVSSNRSYYGTGTPTAVKRGRQWLGLPASNTLCPYDNSYLYSGGYLDAVMLFSPRDQNGDYVTADYSAEEDAADEQKKADWESIVFYFPYWDPDSEELQLRRLAVYKDDLLTGSVAGTVYDFNAAGQGSWTAWNGNFPAGDPTFVDLLDYGTDGTLNGTVDGSIPLTPSTSDAHYDYFQAYTSYWTTAAGEINTTSSLYRYKYFYNSSYYRYFYIYIDRGTGRVWWYVYFYNYSNGAYWYRYRG
ncbi:MAG: type II secretion system protein, partial [Planctomycetes bacterium]|nr:type II secretion system protein [Planctomycetota bacterium]